MSTCLCAGQLQYGLARQLWGHIFTVLSRNGPDGALCACELCARPDAARELPRRGAGNTECRPVMRGAGCVCQRYPA